MRIAVNTRLLLKNRLEGIGWFTYETMRRIAEGHPEHEFIFIFDRPFDPDFIFAANVQGVVIGPPARHPLLFIAWFEFSIPYILKKFKADLFLSPDGYLSLRCKLPQISVIHDLNFEHYPEHLPRLVRWYYKYFFPRFAKKAKRIITVSNYSKSDIIKQYDISPKLIEVAYNGVNTNYQPIADVRQQQIRDELSNGNPYFVFVGALHPRKNIIGLLQSFEIYKNKKASNTHLIIVGNKYWWNDEMENQHQKMLNKSAVQFIGHLDSKRLNEVVAASIAMVYVSFFEGFGIPILEAFRAETAVITSNVTSMPEVAQDAALLVDPFDYESIAKAMETMDSDSEIRQAYIEKGKIRAKYFSWDQTAKAVWESIQKEIIKL